MYKVLFFVCAATSYKVFAEKNYERTASSQKPIHTVNSSTAKPNNVKFSPLLLEKRGVSQEVSDYYSAAPRFRAGRHSVIVLLNGDKLGTTEVEFDTNGNLCINKELLSFAGLNIPSGDTALALNANGCYDYLVFFPQTEVDLRPNRNEISIIVSSDTIAIKPKNIIKYAEGGNAGILNYDLFNINNSYNGNSLSYTSLSTEAGFNIDDWVFRSRQMLTISDNNKDFQTLYSYTQKSIVEIESTLQLGELNIQSSAFSGASITGLQLTPEHTLKKISGSGSTINGFAQTQARVEVRQMGALIHSTLVPTGPFSIENVKLLTKNNDVEVSVIELDGSKHSYSIPASTLAINDSMETGLSFAFGKLRGFEYVKGKPPFVATTSNSWNINGNSNLVAGIMLTDDNYQSIAGTLSNKLGSKAHLKQNITLSNDANPKSTGAKMGVGISGPIYGNINGFMDFNHRTLNYVDILDRENNTHHKNNKNFIHNQYSIGAIVNHSTFGNVSANYNNSFYYDGRESSSYNFSWGKSFKDLSIRASIEKSFYSSFNDSNITPNRAKSRETIQFSMNIPIGNSRSIRSYTSSRNGESRIGSSYNDTSSSFLDYQLSAERNLSNEKDEVSGNFSFLPRYAKVGLGYTKADSDYSSYQGAISGGLVMHKEGITFSPYPIGDTFALARVGNISGVELNTPSGKVWTDFSGQAVIPRVPPYQASTVHVVTNTLPKRIDITNATAQINSGKGSVNHLNFKVTESRRILLISRMPNGEPLPKGVGVTDSAGAFITSTLESGNIFIDGDAYKSEILVSLGNGKSCKLTFKLDETPKKDAYFEEHEAICI